MRARFGASGLTVLCTLLVFGCGTPDLRQFEIRTRNPAKLLDPNAQLAAYREEYDYVRSRRLQLDGARPDVEDGSSNAPPRDLLGISFSGGGIRSATFSLGVLQGLGYVDVLDQLDYTSAVSGGGYLAGWDQAHLGADAGFERDEYAYEVNDRDPSDVLRNHNDHVEHLRTHSGFLNQGGWFEGLTMFKDWAWRWPFHVVLDDVLHYRGRYNFQHIIDIYRSRIEGTYFRGEPPSDAGVRSIPEMRLVDVNAPGREGSSAYLILNGNLTNQGESRVGVSYPNATDAGERWNFEFTRDFTGSDATGYVRSAAFGLQVDKVIEKDGVPVRAVVDLDGADSSDFRLSQAVAASGAAFDSIAAGSLINTPVVTELAQLVGSGVLNLNLGLDAPNFAREYDGKWATVYDYFRMTTWQRVPRWTGPDARWLQITDGGHYENLGALALLRRGTRCIVAIDASADLDRRFGDLRLLRRRAEEELGLKWVTPLPDDGRKPLARFVLENKSHEAQSVILYVKASANEEFPHMKDHTAAAEEETAKRRVKAIQTDLETALKALLDQLASLPEVASPQLDARRKELERISRSDITALEPGAPRHEAASSSLEMDRLAVKQKTDAAQTARATSEQAAQVLATAQRAVQGTPLPAEPPVVEVPPEEAARKAAKELEPLRAAIDEGQRAEKLSVLELAREEGTPTTVQNFDHRIAEPFMARLQPLLAPLGEAGAAKWQTRFQLVVARARARLDFVARRDRSPEDGREARADRIARIRAFSDLSLTFPHNSTLWQWYEWERFEAYRLLGYQMATTYLEPFSPAADDASLSWCAFPPEFDTDTVGKAP